MALPSSSIVHRLEQEIATLSFEEKLWLLTQIAQQIQPSFSKTNLIEEPEELLNQVEVPQISTTGELQRQDGILMIIGSVQGNPNTLDEIREERIQELMGL
jgi:hypothetical protein